MRSKTTLGLLALTFAAMACAYVVGSSSSQDAIAQVSPVSASARDYYVPNSEDLDPDEMRVGRSPPSSAEPSKTICSEMKPSQKRTEEDDND